MGYYIYINGFHGTDINATEEILKTKKFKTRTNLRHWLGQGTYFFRDDPVQAMSWARITVQEKMGTRDKTMKANVIKASIPVHSSKYMNLNSREGLEKLNRLIVRIEESVFKLGYSVQETNRIDQEHKFRCMILDLIPKEIIKVIESSFSSHTPSFLKNKEYKELMGLEMHSIQVCVRDNKLIDKASISIYEEAIINNKNFIQKPSKKKKSSRVIKYE